MLNKEIPVVFFDRVAECNNTISVVIDNYRAGYEVASHLIEQGCKRIVHLGGNLLRNVYSDRFRGYRQALEDNGIKFSEDLLIISELNNQAGIDAAREIMRMKKKPDGLFTANDTTAVAAICELQKAGIKVPEDIAVAGFNNEPVSQVIQPNLTTIDYPAREIGEIAATLLINKLTNSETISYNSIILKHKLIERQSTIRNIH
jgi:LacI family transcriptional regulator